MPYHHLFAYAEHCLRIAFEFVRVIKPSQWRFSKEECEPAPVALFSICDTCNQPLHLQAIRFLAFVAGGALTYISCFILIASKLTICPTLNVAASLVFSLLLILSVFLSLLRGFNHAFRVGGVCAGAITAACAVAIGSDLSTPQTYAFVISLLLVCALYVLLLVHLLLRSSRWCSYCAI